MNPKYGIAYYLKHYKKYKNSDRIMIKNIY